MENHENATELAQPLIHKGKLRLVERRVFLRLHSELRLPGLGPVSPDPIVACFMLLHPVCRCAPVGKALQPVQAFSLL